MTRDSRQLRFLLSGLALALELLLLRQRAPDFFALFYAKSNAPLTTLFVMLGVGILAVQAMRPWRLPAPRPVLNGWLAIHLAVAIGLYMGLSNLSKTVLSVSQATGFALAFLSLGALLASWGACLLSPRDWIGLLRENFFPLVALVVYSALSVQALAAAGRVWAGAMVDKTFQSVEWVLSFGFDQIFSDPAEKLIGAEDFQIRVAHACAGFEGIGLISSFLLLYLALRREELRFPLALCILPLGMFLSWCFNVLRIAVLVWIGVKVSPELAVGVFHARGGWITFIVLAIGFVCVLELTGLFRKAKSDGSEFPSLPYLLPQFVQLALTLLFSALLEGLDLAYPLRLAIVGIVAIHCLLILPERVPHWSEPSLGACGIGILVYLIWIPLAGGEPVEDPRAQLTAVWAELWLLSRLVGSVLIVPLIEELAFRGYLLRRLQSRWFLDIPVGQVTAVSVIVSSLAFGFLHQAWFAGTLAGLAYAYATTLRGSLADAVVAHALTNLCIAVHVVAANRWDLWI